jgi:hypothetical protein
MALVVAYIELATKKDDLIAYNYLINRLAISDFKEERSSIISKLTVWPGAERHALAVFPILLNACRVEKDDKLKYLILKSLGRMMKQNSMLSRYYQPSIFDLKESLRKDKEALAILGNE